MTQEQTAPLSFDVAYAVSEFRKHEKAERRHGGNAKHEAKLRDEHRLARARIVAGAKRELSPDSYNSFLKEIGVAESSSYELLKIAEGGLDEIRRQTASRVAEWRERQEKRNRQVKRPPKTRSPDWYEKICKRVLVMCLPRLGEAATARIQKFVAEWRMPDSVTSPNVTERQQAPAGKGPTVKLSNGKVLKSLDGFSEAARQQIAAAVADNDVAQKVAA